MRPEKRSTQVVAKGINYLIKTQRLDGSWSGPLSSRVRETYLVELLSDLANWKDLNKIASKWLNTHNSLSFSPDEKLFNVTFERIRNNKHYVDLRNPLFYKTEYLRKSLSMYSLAIIAGKEVKVPGFIDSDEKVLALIRTYLSLHNGEIKGWALAELLACKLIVNKAAGSPIDHEKVNQLLRLANESNWYCNPATTALCLIAINYASPKHWQKLDLKKFHEFFKIQMQKDYGWSYCQIPIWDTALALETINIYESSNKLNIDLLNAKRLALHYIKINQNSNGGWGFNTNLESESDTTSMLLYAIHTLSLKKIINMTLDYYKELQFESGKYKGLWPVWRKTERPSKEVVAHIVTALNATRNESLTKKATKWLIQKYSGNSKLAEWGRSLPYSICAAINALPNESKLHKELIDYLQANQNSDGGWGATPGSKSNASATANAIIALKRSLLRKEVDKEIGLGENYLYANQSEEGDWPRAYEVIGPRPLTYADDASTFNFAMQAILLQ